MLTLALILEEYRRDHPGASPASREYQQLMLDIENTLVECPDTTGKALEVMLTRGNGQVDMAVSYEANAIATVDKGRSDIKIVYPLPTIIVNFPCAVLRHAPWVKPEEAAYGQKFVDYLRTPEVQQRALDFGFRPALAVTHSLLDDAFNRPNRKDAGARPDAPAVPYPGNVREVDDLIYRWSVAFPQYK